VDGLAQRLVVQKVGLLDVNGGAGAQFLGGGPAFDAIQPHGANLAGQAHLDDVSGFASLDQAQCAVGDEAAHSFAHRPGG